MPSFIGEIALSRSVASWEQEQRCFFSKSFPSFIGYSDPLNMPYSNPKLPGSLQRKSPTRLSASRVERHAAKKIQMEKMMNLIKLK
jgi:hypothetical protein